MFRGVANATNNLSAIAPARAPPDSIGLNQHHLITTLCELNRRVDARKAPSNDHNVTLNCIGQWRILERGAARCRVIGSGVLRGVFYCTQSKHVAFSKGEKGWTMNTPRIIYLTKGQSVSKLMLYRMAAYTTGRQTRMPP